MSSTVKQASPLPPTLRSVSPNVATLGSGPTVFDVYGTNFDPAVQVRVHGFGSEGSKLDTRFKPTSVSSMKLELTLPASFFQLQGGELGFSALNPAPPATPPGAPAPHVSNEIVIPVYAPAILGIDPAAVTAGEPATLTIVASHLLAAPDGSRRTDVLVDGVILDRAASTVDLARSHVVAQVPGELLAAGAHRIMLVNAIPNPPGGGSNTVLVQAS